MKKSMLLIALLLPVLAGQAAADPSVQLGVLGMNPVLHDSYAAVWVPVPDGQAIAGIRWFNNDANVVFPRVMIASDDAEAPVALDAGTVVATDVQGVSSGWSQVMFTQPIACQGSGLYCLFVFPAGSVYAHDGAGGGAAIGYTAGAGGHQGWFCVDAESQMRVAGPTGLAIDPVFVLAQPGMVQKSQPRAAVAVASVPATLRASHPNPFNPQTVLEFSLPAAQHVELSIFDVSGRLVRRLVHEQRTAGTHSVTWRGEDEQGRRVPSGMYFARFVAGSVNQTQHLTLVK